MVPQSGIASVFGLPTHTTVDEERRLLEALPSSGTAVGFAVLAAGAEDRFLAYAALFALLTRGTLLTVELPNGEVGYRRSTSRHQPPKRPTVLA